MMKFVGYVRVSTKKQGQSGLGLQAQQRILSEFAARADGQLLENFVEVESGRKNARLELQKAIAFAKERGAVLLVAKLDRLSRNVRFLAELMESKVEFRCCDLPECDPFTIHLFAALAQKEAELISSRTKAALQAKKAQGFVLGKPENLKPEHRTRAAQVRREQAANNGNNRRAAELIKLLRPEGHSLRQIAARLNAGGFQTSTGKFFTAQAVRLILQRNEM